MAARVMAVLVAETEVHADHRPRPVMMMRDDNHGRRRRTNGGRIDDHGRRRRHMADRRRWRDHIHRGRSRAIGVNWRWRKSVTDNVSGRDSGENFADRGPFTVAGGGGWDTGGGEGGEA